MGRLLRRIVFKGKGKMWPTVTLPGTQLIVYYLSRDDDGVVVRETSGIDFDEFFLHLDCGGSVFVTVKPTNTDTVCDRIREQVKALREGEVRDLPLNEGLPPHL